MPSGMVAVGSLCMILCLVMMPLSSIGMIGSHFGIIFEVMLMRHAVMFCCFFVMLRSFLVIVVTLGVRRHGEFRN